MMETMSENIHNGISCDECGVSPIRGTRYKSMITYDFDICEDCKVLNYTQQGAAAHCHGFTAFQKPVSRVEASKSGPKEINRIYAGSAQDAEQQLKEGKNSHVAFFRFYGKTPSTEECQEVVNFINRNAFLTNINVCLFCFQNSERAFAAMAQGLAHNKSVKHLSLRLMPLWNQDTFFDTSSVKNLIENNPVLESLHIGHAFLRDFHESGSYYSSEDKFALQMFESLQKNRSLKTFRLETISHLSQDTNEYACKAALMNPLLTRVFAKFQNPTDKKLEMLTTFNRYRWMKRWTDIAASPKDRVNVMAEILSLSSDPSGLFYLFRSFPEALDLQSYHSVARPEAESSSYSSCSAEPMDCDE